MATDSRSLPRTRWRPRCIGGRPADSEPSDDQNTLALYTLLLELQGYRVLTAASGQAALRQLGTAPIQGVILDRRLPDGDGLEVCRQVCPGGS